MNVRIVFFLNCCLLFLVIPQLNAQRALDYCNDRIRTGAEQTERYVPYLKGKRVAILGNPSTVIKDKHLVDSLLTLGVNIVKVFGPEHGFRGNASNGTEVGDEVDPQTNIPIISLYGSKRKPSGKDLANVDVFIFDVQDMGVRFYTNINTLRDIMEACAEHDKELLILDRPNPNAYLIDGPILDEKHKSGIGQFPVPIAHGMTTADQVLIHMLALKARDTSVFTLETGRLFPETYYIWNRTLERYGVPIRAFYPQADALEAMVSSKGPTSFYESVENRKECCFIRKIEPLRRAIKGFDVWITGIRGEQSPNREDMGIVEWDEGNGIIKIHPLFYWSDLSNK